MNIDDIYPLVIVADRYGSCYSGGKYLAFNMYDAPDGACSLEYSGRICILRYILPKDV